MVAIEFVSINGSLISGGKGMKRVGLLGFGAIGQAIAGGMLNIPAVCILSTVCVRSSQKEAAKRLLPLETRVTDNIADFLAADLELVVEAAGVGALVENAESILMAGKHLYVLSVGALADSALVGRLTDAARREGASISVPCGALAGFDGLLALRQAGLISVSYTATKPPYAWLGTTAESVCSLDSLREPFVIFRGNAADAVRNYPKNANIAAAVAIAGIGFEATQVELIADPDTKRNTGRVIATSAGTSLDLTVTGQSFEANPKSSAVTAVSVLSSLANSAASLKFV
jgi:aspartate dehydrogenase